MWIHSLTREAKNVQECAELCIRAARQQGALISLNHPFTPHAAARYNFDLSLFDTIEVCHSYCEGKLNINDVRSVRAFDKLWHHGYQIFAVGGSDFHAKARSEYSRPGKPATHFLADSLSPESVITSLKQGSSFITCSCEVEFQLTEQVSGTPILWGQEVSADTAIHFHGACQETLNWQLLINGELSQQVENNEAVFNFLLDDGDFARIEARNSEGNLKVFFNPIYSGRRPHKPLEWLALKEQIEGSWQP